METVATNVGRTVGPVRTIHCVLSHHNPYHHLPVSHDPKSVARKSSVMTRPLILMVTVVSVAGPIARPVRKILCAVNRLNRRPRLVFPGPESVVRKLSATTRPPIPTEMDASSVGRIARHVRKILHVLALASFLSRLRLHHLHQCLLLFLVLRPFLHPRFRHALIVRRRSILLPQAVKVA